MDAKIQIIKEISKLFLNLNKEITYRKKVKSEEWRMERIRGDCLKTHSSQNVS